MSPDDTLRRTKGPSYGALACTLMRKHQTNPNLFIKKKKLPYIPQKMSMYKTQSKAKESREMLN